MDSIIKTALEKLSTRPGQGGLLEQLDKLLREQQRIVLGEMFKGIKENDLDDFVVELYAFIPQIRMKNPALVRFHLPEWEGYNDVFWRALGDYLILALHSVTDVDFDGRRGVLKISYFHAPDSRKSPEDIKKMIQGLALLIERRKLPTDFTLFRRMDERHKSIGEISKTEATVIGGMLELTRLIR